MHVLLHSDTNGRRGAENWNRQLASRMSASIRGPEEKCRARKQGVEESCDSSKTANG